jgi:hydroxymethylpyrimidine pyrophosphatase-like HAD family hydrolase
MTNSLPPALLATDLDGTLAVNGVIGQDERRAAAELKAEGIPVLVITGRNLYSLGRVEHLWEVADEVLFSSGAGHQVSRNGRTIERVRLGEEDVRTIAELLEATGEDFCVLDTIPLNHRYTWSRSRNPAENPDFDNRMRVYDPWGEKYDGRSAPASQILVIRPPGTGPDPLLLEKLGRWSVFCGTSPLDHKSVWMEIFPAGLNKGSALSSWCSDHGISRERVLVLGNDLNDESMLEWARYARVVEGSPAELTSRFPVLPPAGQGGFPAAAREAIGLFGRKGQSGLPTRRVV